MKISIIGLGAVGKTVQTAFSAAQHDIYCFDKNQSDYQSFENILQSDCVFVCVPTDLVDGRCDLTHVEEQIKRLSDFFYTGEIIIKSTVIPGTTEKFINEFQDLKITFVPEFLRQDHALEDFTNSKIPVLIGTHDPNSFLFVSKLHQQFHQRSVHITPTEAELVKYFSNVFNSTRIVFANIFFEICSKIGVNYQNVLEAAINLPNIQNDHYLKCNKDMRGYAGKCLPKDIAAFSSFTKDLEITANLFDSVIKDNQRYVK